MRGAGLPLVLLALLAAGCGGGAGTTTEEVAPTTPTPTGTARPADGVDRPKAPAIEGESLDGARISLANFRGRPVFVNVWSSW
jgi:hypothetical protein